MSGCRSCTFVMALLGLALAGPVQAQASKPAPVTDPSAVNVCERVPGAEVAKAFGKTLRSEKAIVFKDSKLSRCVYILAAAEKPDAPTDGLVLWLYAPGEYEELGRHTEGKMEPVAGLGDEAVRFVDPGDKRHKVRLLRRGRFALEATAVDAARALALAKLAFARFD